MKFYLQWTEIFAQEEISSKSIQSFWSLPRSNTHNQTLHTHIETNIVFIILKEEGIKPFTNQWYRTLCSHN